jgi:hypothetical protein
MKEYTETFCNIRQKINCKQVCIKTRYDLSYASFHCRVRINVSAHSKCDLYRDIFQNIPQSLKYTAMPVCFNPLIFLRDERGSKESNISFFLNSNDPL